MTDESGKKKIESVVEFTKITCLITHTSVPKDRTTEISFVAVKFVENEGRIAVARNFQSIVAIPKFAVRDAADFASISKVNGNSCVPALSVCGIDFEPSKRPISLI